MSRVETLIFSKAYELYRAYSQSYTTFPKAKRYTLGSTIDRHLLDVIELIIEAEYTTKKDKLLPLQKLSIKVDLVKVLIRLACETKCIETKNYQILSSSLVEIGKMLGGWIKTLR